MVCRSGLLHLRHRRKERRIVEFPAVNLQEAFMICSSLLSWTVQNPGVSSSV